MTGPSTFIIAEAGVNHNGSLQRALEMVDAAAAAGADAVKFQTFSADALTTAAAPKAAYQAEQTGEGGSQQEMLRSLELSAEDHRELLDRCTARGVVFMSAAFDPGSFELLSELGIDRVKIASGELTNVPFLRRVARLGLPTYLSTGMATLDEVRVALDVLEAAGLPRERVTVLQCTTEYPTPPVDVNLRAMLTMRDELGVAVGYSDHTQGIHVPIAAVALGAEVLEKHFTLDRALPGPDHAASLEPGELAEMVHCVREIEVALGDGVKRPTATEQANAAVARKSIVAATAIEPGARFTETNVTVKRPGTGISPLHWDGLLGRRALRAYAPDELIAEEELA